MTEWGLKKQVLNKKLMKNILVMEYRMYKRYKVKLYGLFAELQAVYYDCLGQCLAYEVLYEC